MRADQSAGYGAAAICQFCRGEDAVAPAGPLDVFWALWYSTNYSLYDVSMIYIGADHRGFTLKEHLKKCLADWGTPFEDAGNTVLDPNDDYPDFAKTVAEKVSQNTNEHRGILICGSGIGMAVAADKFPGIRAGLCASVRLVEMGRRDDDINILALAADVTDEKTAQDIARGFLHTPFSGEEHHRRRIEKIAQLER